MPAPLPAISVLSGRRMNHPGVCEREPTHAWCCRKLGNRTAFATACFSDMIRWKLDVAPVAPALRAAALINCHGQGVASLVLLKCALFRPRPSSHLEKTPMKCRSSRLILGAVVLSALAAGTQAQSNSNYPSRPVRMIVPFAPGGASDFVGRILQPKLSEELGQQVVVDNRAGAAGNIGVEMSAVAPADGYTFLLGNVGTMAINPAVYTKFQIRPVRDFICVSTVVDVAGALAVHPSVPGNTLKDFVEYAKSRPGKLNYGAAAASSAQGLTMEYLKLKTGIDVQQIAYKGGAGPATTALLGGEVVASLVTVASFVPHVKSGRVKVLAVVAPKRVAALPEVPTFLELGFNELKLGSWQGVYVPKSTPPAVVKRLHTAVMKVMADAWVIERLAAGGADVVTSKSPEDCGGFMQTQTEFWAKLVKQVGVTAD